MADEIQALIAKINEEGVNAAELKAEEIEDRAKALAEEIIKKAKIEADAAIKLAWERIAREEEKQRALLSQAGRDLLLSLRQEINSLLQKIILRDVRQAMTTQVMGKIIAEFIKNYGIKQTGTTVVSISPQDLAALEKEALAKLGEELKKGLILRPSEEIMVGFIISFDAGKSCYDFSDKALSEYIFTFLKPKLAELLSEVA